MTNHGVAAADDDSTFCMCAFYSVPMHASEDKPPGRANKMCEGELRIKKNITTIKSCAVTYFYPKPQLSYMVDLRMSME